jgi:hypothetical protein
MLNSLIKTLVLLKSLLLVNRQQQSFCPMQVGINTAGGYGKGKIIHQQSLN